MSIRPHADVSSRSGEIIYGLTIGFLRWIEQNGSFCRFVDYCGAGKPSALLPAEAI